METVADRDTVTEVDLDSDAAEQIPCEGQGHSGPLSSSEYHIRQAASHDPAAFAAFLIICPACDRQAPLCEAKVLVLMTWKTSHARCTSCGVETLVADLECLPL